MPAAKKHSSTRARANRSSTAATLVDVPNDCETPLLEPVDHDWHPMVLKWWDAIWAAPMSGEYHDSDVHQLFLLAMVYDDFYNCEPGTVRRAQLAAEIRQQRAAFGMTPYDRRRLEWTIETAESAKDRGRERRGRQMRTPMGKDPRDLLRSTS